MEKKENIQETLAATLKELRLSKKMTQTELSAKCGVTQATISEIENGKGNPTLEVINKIAGALAVPSSALLGAGVLTTMGVAIGLPIAGAVIAAMGAASISPALRAWISKKLLEGCSGDESK